MLGMFESILPVFLVVVAGVVLKRLPVISASFWDGLDQFGYYVLFPALLFETLARADFAAMASGSVVLTAVAAFLAMIVMTLAIWPIARRAGMAAPSFSTLFQTATRWNGFMALALAEKIAGHTGLTVVAVVMAAIVIPTNIVNVAVVTWFSGADRDPRALLVKIFTNPIIIGGLLGVIVNASGIAVYAPVMTAIDLVARSALGLGLIMVGAGLRVSDALKPQPAVVLSTALKLLVFPAVMLAIGLAAGLSGDILLMLALSAGVPTAMNGYVLAKQLGGDAPLYAATTTVQTIAAFFSIPLVLKLAAYATGG
ncbi:AEC family transporter [Rhizobium halophytocola]|uniref:Permease n=1 Tax=Rhizobium halophytocola TaxID=735519 RepID=A0ABS4DY06_9HYPH|nr:AEC family transporter [Rhizobium halophytocola]MBP1850582.1 putative permease [Rhizobium halophytocola]